MASCPKCGKTRLRKDTRGFRKCPRCGVLPGPAGLERSGMIGQAIEPRNLFWWRMALEDYREALLRRKQGHRDLAMQSLKQCRRWLEMSHG